MKQLHDDDVFLKGIKHIHMIGIGGSGMCPLAELLMSLGYTVSGSDAIDTELTRKLSALGVKISIGQQASNVHGAQLVAYSAAVAEDNPERAEAKKLGIPTMERSHLLGAVTRHYDNVIGVCGTHGKTTVTSMITQILLLNKREPNAVIGGKLPMVDSYCVTGSSQTLVCESCEFVDSFLQFSPDVTVLLNIDNDHMDYFKTMQRLEQSFKSFVSMSRVCYAFGDDERVRRVVSDIPSRVVKYGFDASNDFYPVNITAGKRGFCFDVMHSGKCVGSLCLVTPGRHNILNALVSFAVCFDMGVDPQGIAAALEKFTGAGRRLEFLGEFNSIAVADDYAHHPTEMEASLRAVKELDYGKVIVAFQPYTYSRVDILRDGMIKALSIADKVFLTPIVAAREENVHGVSSRDIASQIPGAQVIDGYDELSDKLISAAEPGDIIITMGAGDIYKAARMVTEKLRK